jgi:hypothetical protein
MSLYQLVFSIRGLVFLLKERVKVNMHFMQRLVVNPSTTMKKRMMKKEKTNSRVNSLQQERQSSIQ